MMMIDTANPESIAAERTSGTRSYLVNGNAGRGASHSCTLSTMKNVYAG
jgi:hypothetical protein